MKKQILWMYLLLFSCIALGQTGNTPSYDTPAVIPQSPETASLLRYSEVPVSYYNGIPNVGVPIYTLQGRELAAPVNLSYHAGGRRVTEEAGWVGLGWNLSAGGQISRTVRGKRDDKKPHGFIHNQYTVDIVKRTCDPQPNDPPLPYNHSCEYYTANGNGFEFDFEPDDFNYSMLGQSGRFMFNQDRSSIATGKIIQFPNKNVIIEPVFQVYDPNDPNNPDNTDSGNIIAWNITDTNGNVFHFEEGNIFHQSQTYQEINGAIEFPNGGNSTESYTETWDLVSVTSPNGDVITFEYDRPILPNHTAGDPYNDVTTTVGSESFIVYDGRYQESTDPNASQNLHPNRHIKTYSVVYRSYTVLSKIISSKGSVEFVRDTQDRQDTQSSKQRLAHIKILDNDQNELQRIELEHSYLQSLPSTENEFVLNELNGHIPANTQSYLSKRLQLDRVVFQGMHGGHNAAEDYSYRFEYNTDVMLPHKRSQAQDHWGYYNGALTNNSLIPRENYFISDRNANPAFSSACILNKITYPEGGVTKLFYENNRGDTNYSLGIPYQEKVAKVETKPNYPHVITENATETIYSFTSDFSISANAKPSATDASKTQVSYVGFSNRCDTEDSLYNTPSDQVCQHMTFTITNTTDNVIVYTGSIWDNGFLNLTKDKDYQLEINITDSFGQYDMSQHSSEVTVKWLDENVNPPDDYNFDYFGGLRIHAIKTYDKNKLTAYRSFEYAFGSILSRPEYFSVSTDNIQKFVSQSWVPLLTTQAGYVGYGQVKEIIHPVDIETGYSTLGTASVAPREIFRKYSFISEADNQDLLPAFPGAPFIFEWMGGNLQLEKIEDKSTTIHEYLIQDTQDIEETEGLAINRDYRISFFSLENLDYATTCRDSGICRINRHLYTLWSGRWLPVKQTTISKEGTRELTQETETFFESIPHHHNPTKTLTTDSKGDVYETVYRYPYEENHTGLLAENRLGTPLVTKQYKDTELMQTSKVNFGVFTGTATNISNLLPATVQAAKKANVLEDRVTYHQYTPYGQPREVSKTDGTHITYLWGYDYNYPVAKIENATFAEVNALVSEASLQNLSGIALDTALSNLRNALPNAMVSTFIYQSLIGVTQTTDPRGRNTYYQYDGMGRLKYVLDHQMHVLSENNYHYKNN